MVRHIVKPGEFREFVEGLKALNDAAEGAGLPRYRAWVTQFGDMNEVWTEAEFESVESHVAAFKAAGDNDEFMAVFRGYLEHFVPGTIRDYPLEPIELG